MSTAGRHCSRHRHQGLLACVCDAADDMPAGRRDRHCPTIGLLWQQHFTIIRTYTKSVSMSPFRPLDGLRALHMHRGRWKTPQKSRSALHTQKAIAPLHSVVVLWVIYGIIHYSVGSVMEVQKTKSTILRWLGRHARGCFIWQCNTDSNYADQVETINDNH